MQRVGSLGKPPIDFYITLVVIAILVVIELCDNSVPIDELIEICLQIVKISFC